MKRKIFTFFLGAMVAGVAFAQQPTGEIVKATTAPLIDGVIDDVWASANEYNIDKPFQSEVPTLGASGETTWKGLWNNDGMFVLLKVTDDGFWPNYAVSPAGNNWEYDKPEIYWDVNYILADGIGAGGNAGHYQYAPGFTLDKNDGTMFEDANNHQQYAFMVSTPYTGYIGEYFIPWAWLVDKDGVGVDLGANVGFDVTIIDREDGDAARKRAVWANIGLINESYSNMDDAGIITFPEFGGNVYVESITLTGGTITTDNGTLQLVAEVLPADATNKNLKYVATSVTGRALVSSTGLVTGLINGDVTIIAYAVDGSYVESAPVTVTISGQVVQKADVNVIKNGNFDSVEPNGQATSWGGWADLGSVLPNIVDGVAVCTPPAGAANNWQYQFSQSNLTALPNIDYIFSFQAWADVDRVGTVDFEDTPGNNYNRYGVSSDVESTGRSEWQFNLGTIPAWYTFHVNFDQMVETTVQKVQFMIAQTADIVYIDSVSLISVDDFSLISNGIAKNTNKTKVVVYPNPATDVLNVNLATPNAKVAIYNSVGSKVDEAVVTGTKGQFDVRNYAHGVYFVKVNNETVTKFVR